jgi:hypothetical protein
MEKDILKRLEDMIGDCTIGPMRTLKTADLTDVLYDAHQEIALLRQALEKIIHEDLWTTKHPDGVTQRGESVFDGYFGGIARAALEGEKR